MQHVLNALATQVKIAPLAETIQEKLFWITDYAYLIAHQINILIQSKFVKIVIYHVLHAKVMDQIIAQVVLLNSIFTQKTALASHAT